ncbi:hypothetical protein L6164_002762 [Bauhinia variegata]|uniref:Uncharacterized protein n=1 Tax=Bauhinia variegata TaxID=167791 RepID=A0ACB9Q182_BAUVA|nr:hypothetical protein L6164_002762 [Bauhinia variegata]
MLPRTAYGTLFPLEEQLKDVIFFFLHTIYFSFICFRVIPNLQSVGIGNKEAYLLYCCIDKYHLNSLKARKLDFLKNAEFPLGLLHRTPSLEELHMWSCVFQELLPPGKLAGLDDIGTVVQLKDLSLIGMSSLHNMGFEQEPALFRQLQSSVERIFDINDEMMTSETQGLAFPLKNMTLDNLPALKNVWNLAKNSHGFFQLSKSTKNCEVMEEIVGKDEAAAEGAISKFKFSCLTALILDGLFKLKYFYPVKHNLECPKLNSSRMFHCDKLEIFTQELYPGSVPEGDVVSSIEGHLLL